MSEGSRLLSGMSATLNLGHDTLTSLIRGWDQRRDADASQALECLLQSFRERTLDFNISTKTQADMEAFMLLDCLLRRWERQTEKDKLATLMSLLQYLDQRRFDLNVYIRNHVDVDAVA